MKRFPLIILTVLVIGALVAAAALWRPGAESRSAENAAVTPSTPPSDFGGPFSLTDQFGRRRTDTDFRGKFMLIFFGYTYCPDVCPTSLASEAEALDKLGSPAGRIVPIFISVDPKRDTPEKLKAYLASFDAKPQSARLNFIGLTGSDEEIAKAAREYNVYYRVHLDGRTENAADYSIDHSGNIYLMSPQGKFVAYYSPGILPDELAADLMLRTAAPR